MTLPRDVHEKALAELHPSCAPFLWELWENTVVPIYDAAADQVRADAWKDLRGGFGGMSQYDQLVKNLRSNFVRMEWNREAADAIEELQHEIERARFLPIGDNHHNARLCPYCSPRSERAAFDKSLVELTEAIAEYEREQNTETKPTQTAQEALGK